MHHFRRHRAATIDPTPAAPLEGQVLYGIDVSNWQADYHWPDVDFGFAKASEGAGYVDPFLDHNRAEAKRVGATFGTYHFARPGSGSAQAQAFHYVETVNPRPGELLCLDLEVNDGQPAAAVAKWAKSWCEIVTRRTGRTPIVYTYLSFARAGNCNGLGGYPLWIADPSAPAGRPNVPPPWTDWSIHQYASKPVDLDIARQLPGITPAPATVEDTDPMSLYADKDTYEKSVKRVVGEAIRDLQVDSRGETPQDKAPDIRLVAMLARTDARVQRLTEALNALADSLSPDVQKAVREALKDNLVHVDVTVEGTTQ